MCAPPEAVDLHTWQLAFAASLLRAGAIMSDRQAVHRNNTRASLSAALAARFPVVARLVGPDFFQATALCFIERQPPTSPVLAEYGAGFAGFLDSFAPARTVPYLADVARLEWTRHLAFHAEDAMALSIERLTAVAPDRLEHVRLGLHPAASVVASAWPVISIWTTNAHDQEVRPLGDDAGSECALVTRPELHVLVSALPAGSDRLVAALAEGNGLAEAVARAAPVEGFDTATALSVLFRSGAVASLTVGSFETTELS
jgi:hypothetical protein